jgi:hypothetical protein
MFPNQKKTLKIERNIKTINPSHAEWFMPIIIPALGKLRQEDQEFEANLDYIMIPCLRKQTNE